MARVSEWKLGISNVWITVYAQFDRRTSNFLLLEVQRRVSNGSLKCNSAFLNLEYDVQSIRAPAASNTYKHQRIIYYKIA